MGDAETHVQYHHSSLPPHPTYAAMPVGPGGALEFRVQGCRGAASVPSASPTPSRGRLRHPPCPARRSRPCPKSSSVPDPVRLGQSGGSRPHRLAPLCASSQADYCPRANILIEGSRQARAPSVPSGPSCHLPPGWRFWGSAEVLGAQDGAGS